MSLTEITFTIIEPNGEWKSSQDVVINKSKISVLFDYHGKVWLDLFAKNFTRDQVSRDLCRGG